MQSDRNDNGKSAPPMFGSFDKRSVATTAAALEEGK